MNHYFYVKFYTIVASKLKSDSSKKIWKNKTNKMKSLKKLKRQDP